jgi:hypothetical protein
MEDRQPQRVKNQSPGQGLGSPPAKEPRLPRAKNRQALQSCVLGLPVLDLLPFYDSRRDPYDNRGLSSVLKRPARRHKVPATSGVPRRKAGSAT